MSDDRNELDPTKLPSTETTAPASGDRQQIGPFHILQKLGEGGMGEVYEAEQTEPVRRRVALKIIKRGMDTRQVVARFEAERQALALMNHPNVAKVFDAGSTPDGRPYFAMELVKGVPITEHCDRQKLSNRERMELFVQVCAGVQHAHQKGIIHRDIKPSNVLVQVQDAERIPKIIDFGVAKATQQRLTERTLFTELGQLIGTPEYMSPEQAEMTAEDIDTRTDVYSLGVLLYELLVGALPFDSKELRRAGFDEIRRRIREEEPSKPSAKLSTMGEPSTESAQRRKTDLRTLKRQLRGDLDWITMKALQKERTRRYGSALQFSEDIQRFLVDEPVIAGPPSRLYRIRKALKRNAKLAAAVAITAVLLTTTLVVGIILAKTRREATHVQFRLEEVQVTASLDAQRAREIALALPRGSNRVESDTSDPREVQPIVDRMARRFLAGRGTADDFQRFAQALIDVSIQGATLQTVDGGSVFVRIDFDGRPLSGDAGRGLGVEFRPRLNLDGVNVADVTHPSGAKIDTFVVPIGEYDAFSFGLTIDLSVYAPGTYVLSGPIELRFGRISDAEPFGAMDDYLSDALILPVPDFNVTLVDDLPEDYPIALRDEQLAVDFEQALVGAVVAVTGTDGGQSAGRFAIHIPPPKVHLPLIVTMGRDQPTRWRRECKLMLSPRRWPSVLSGTVGWDVSESENGGWDISITFGIPGGPRLEENIDLTVDSSREIALSEGLDHYLDVHLSRSLAVKPGSR